MNTYSITIIREAGLDPVTNNMLEYKEENLLINSPNRQSAHRKAQAQTTIKFYGQTMKIFINGEEHFDEKI